MVWGKVMVTVAADRVPSQIQYYDEKGTLVRTMSFTDVKDIEGKKVPMTMTLTPHDKEGEYTRMVYETLHFGIELDDSAFSLQALKR